MRPTSSTRTIPLGKLRLLNSCAVAAGLMALAVAGPSHAQGVAGSGNVTLGNATISPGMPANTTDVVTSTDQTIINWTPTDNAATGGAIDFLPAGNTLNFYGASGQYTVLNRFVSSGGLSLSRVVALNGTVNSFVGAPGNPNSFQSGNIWFYNAGGILIGGGAAINVGSLLLTANDIDTSGGLFSNTNNIRFRGVSGSTSAVTISQGASITASNGNPGGSYVAMVAPRIVQNGFVSTDGSTAYVAAEQADIRINNGLFDINVTVGAEGGDVITHAGTTTGPAHQEGNSSASRIYFVAMPKNDAVTMLVSGQVGYADAVTAQIEPNGAVRLSGGYNIVGGEFSENAATAVGANVAIHDIVFNSDLHAHSNNALTAAPLGQITTIPLSPENIGRIRVNGLAYLEGDASATVTIGNNQEGIFTNLLDLISGGTSNSAGSAIINVTYDGNASENGGTLIVGNVSDPFSSPLIIDATRKLIPGASDSSGGLARLNIDGGTVTSTGLFLVAQGGTTYSDPGLGDVDSANNGVNGQGGTAEILVNGSSAQLVAESIDIAANGYGSGANYYDPAANGYVQAANGGDGVGGSALLSITNGASVSTFGASYINISANGNGGVGTAVSGIGHGGTAQLILTGSGSRLNSDSLDVSALGNGGTNYTNGDLSDVITQQGGTGTGGTADLILDGDSSTSVTLGDIIISASALGGRADGEGSRGGDARGGAISLAATGGISINPNSVRLSASAESDRTSSPDGMSSTTGDAFGGSISITASGGSVIGSDGGIDLDARGRVTGDENRGSSTGGNIIVRSTAGATISALSEINADASAGRSSGGTTISTGSSTGGDIDFLADGGTISAANLYISASAINPDSVGPGGAAQGGIINLLASNNGILETTDTFSTGDISADAVTGFSLGGSNATGGTIHLISNGGQLDLIGFNYISANGTTGGDLNGGLGNATAGQGGDILVRLLNSDAGSSAMSLGQLSASTNGYTGELSEGSPVSNGGGAANGFGGNVTVDIQGGSLSATRASFSASGFGGVTDSIGGQGTGGTAVFTQSGGTVNIVFDLTVSADGIGGTSYAGGKSGDGAGGTATINFTGGTFTGQDITASASGYGGYGRYGDDNDSQPSIVSDGGNGTGGTAAINLTGISSVTTQTMTVTSAGYGGRGGDFYSYYGTTDDTGHGGNGTGGSATINLDQDGVQGALNVGVLTSDASGTGGNGGSFYDTSFSSSAPPTGTGVGGNGGTGTGGTATINAANTVNASAIVTSKAIGQGGNGGGNSIGGNGGDSQGGVAELVVTDFDAGSLSLTLDASAQGGNGADGTDGNGGNGGTANGGTSRVQLHGQNANATIDQSIFVNNGNGGNGGNAFLLFGNNPAFGPSGGNGGDGVGGIIEITASGGSATLNPGDSGNVMFGGGGTGGNGGNGADNLGVQGGDAGNGGNGIGGTVHILANGGTISSNGNAVDITVAGTEGAGGIGGYGTAGFGTSGAAGYNRGGVVTLESQDSESGSGSIEFGDTTIMASGDIAGRINLTNSSAGVGITLASLDATTNGADITSIPSSPSDSGIYISSRNGQILVDGDASLQSDGIIAFDMLGDGLLAINGSLDASSSSLISATQGTSSNFGPSVLAAGGLYFESSGDIITDSQAQFSATGDLNLIAGGKIDIAFADAGGNLYVEGGSVGIDFAGSGGSTNLVATGSDVRFGAIESGTSTGIDAFGGVFGGDITAGSDLTITAGAGGQIDSLFAGDDIRLNFAGALSIGTTTTDGSGGDNEEDGSNVVITAGDTDINHSETADNFTANVASFRTGLHSLITGGDININSPGAVDLGNSTAGGFIQVFGQSIDFVALDAGSTVNLSAGGTIGGAEGIRGVDIVAGGDVSLSGNSIAISNSLQSGGGLFAFATGGTATINGADTVGNISVFADGDLSGNFISGGNINLQSNAAVTASAVANGGFIDGNSNVSEGTVYIIAASDVTLTNSSAATMFGVSAGQAASLTNAGAGEDMLVLAGTTAALTNASAGDDVIVRADGTISAQGVSATGAGSDSRELLFTAGGPSGAPSMFVTNATAADGADIILASNNGSIIATTLSAGDDIGLAAGSGAVNVNGAATLGLGVTGGDSSITSTSLTGSFTGLDAATDVDLTIQTGTSAIGTIMAGRDIIIDANATSNASASGSLAAGRDIYLNFATTSSLGNLTAANKIDIASGGDLATGDMTATSDLTVTAAGNGQFGNVMTTGGGNLSLDGGTGIFASTVSSTGATSLNSDAGNIVINQLASSGLIFASGDSVTVDDGIGNLVFSQLDADVGLVEVVNSGGDITVMSGAVAGLANLATIGNHDIVVNQWTGNLVSLSSGGNMSLTNISAASRILATANRGMTIDGLVTGNQIDLNAGDVTITSSGLAGSISPTSSVAIAISALRMLTVDGVVTGNQITLASGDIDITDAGQVGTAGATSSLNISNSDTSSQTFIGGTGSRNGYHLDADEMTRIFSNNIEIFAPKVQTVGGGAVGGSAPPDLVIDSFALTAGGPTSNLGANGALTLSTPGKARVIGDVSLTGLSDNNGLNIFADNALEVILGTGTIRLTGTGSDPAGVLFLQSDDIIVATSAAINDVAAAGSTNAINTRLAQNDGITSDDGALYAGGINVNVVSGFYVQNSGDGTDFAQRRGLTFGALGFNVTTASSATRIVVNGQQLGPNGTINGLDTIALLNISSGSSQTGSTTASFDPRSTLNGCLIANVASCSAPVIPEIYDDFPVQDVIDKNSKDDDDDADDGSGGIPLPLIELREIDPLPGQPLLDDPVTGAGNDDLWSTPAE